MAAAAAVAAEEGEEGGQEEEEEEESAGRLRMVGIGVGAAAAALDDRGMTVVAAVVFGEVGIAAAHNS